MNSKTPAVKPWWKHWEVALIGASITIAVIFAAIVVIIAAIRPLSALEATLFQILALGAGLGGGLFGSYKFGQRAAANRLYARSALRSVLVLYNGIVRLYQAIEVLKTGKSDERLDLLQLQIQDQMEVANAAINDWRDVITDGLEDVDGMLQQFESGERN